MGFFDRFRAKKTAPEKRNFIDYALGFSGKNVLVNALVFQFDFHGF